jgi:hypothetical protein
MAGRKQRSESTPVEHRETEWATFQKATAARTPNFAVASDLLPEG